MIATTGFFDGVHLGHRQVIRQVVDAALARGTEGMVITFWPHPRNVLQKDARGLRLLTSLDEKRQLLEGLGVSRVEVIRFTRGFSRLSTEEYLRDWVRDRFGATGIVLGYDNRMGSNQGAPDEIAGIAAGLGLEVIRASEVTSGDVVVSSTKIREALCVGRVEEAARMLGRDYSLLGVVVEGNRLGRTIGFPTANMQLYEPLKLIPENGVYLVDVQTLGREWHGMCNIGVCPTVSPGNALSVETHIFGFDEDIYGLDLRVRFRRRIRGEIRFPSLEALRGQLEKDRATCLEMLQLN